MHKRIHIVVVDDEPIARGGVVRLLAQDATVEVIGQQMDAIPPARAGLGPRWECLFANDIDPKKAASYAANWGDDRLRVSDVADLAAYYASIEITVKPK